MARRIGTFHHAIRVENLHYTYPLATPALPVPALQGIDLIVEAGEFLAIMGPLGAGKTTLCLALNGLVPQSTGGIFRGDVWVAGYNTKVHPVAALATEVGLVFQEAESQLFNMTVEEEVAFGPESLGLPVEEIERRVQWALDIAGLAKLQTRSPAQLSGGQQRRLAIAAIVAMRPNILILDEPTADLDPVGRVIVLDAIAELRRQGITVIIATQDADAVAAMADRVIILEAGRIVLEGAPQQVFGQVEHVHALGVGVPQVTELSHCLHLDPLCLTVEQAFQALSGNNWRRSPGRATAWTSVRFRPEGSAELAASNSVEPPETAGLLATRALGQPAIIFENTWYRYAGGVQALAGVNLSIAPGEYIALIGANGSGKTTLAKHVNGLLRPQQGRVLVAGCDTRRISTGELARRVGYVFQNPDHQIFAPTVWEEVAFGPHNLGLDRAEIEKRVEIALRTFDLAPLASVPPTNLGYGQRRLLTLAAVHAMQPQVLILDEPMAGLDRRLTSRLVEWVSGLWEAGATILLITHDMRFTSLVPRCVVMDHGQVILDALTTQVFAQSERLLPAGIASPPLVELSRRLGLPATPLTVDDFCHAFVRWSGEVATP